MLLRSVQGLTPVQSSRACPEYVQGFNGSRIESDSEGELPRFGNSRNVEMRTVRLPKDLAGLGERLLVLYGDFGIG
jgi:hypothetical protein